MKASLLQENLNKGISFVSRFISSNPQLKILSNIKIEAKKGQLLLSATNLETGINLKLGAKVDEEGSLTVPAKIIQEFVGFLPKDKICIESAENNLKISCQDYKAIINGTGSSEFPKIPSLEEKKNALLIKKESFLKAVEEVAFAAAGDETRPVLTAVLVRKTDGEFLMVATDGYRLSLRKTKAFEEKGKSDFKEVLVSSRILMEVSRLLSETEGEIWFSQDPEQNQVIIKSDQWEVVTRLIEGEFPPFEKIIPKDQETTFQIETEVLKQAVKTAAIFARDSSNIIRWEFKKGGVLLVSANAPQVGENIITLTGKLEGEPGKIAFNSRFLLDLLNIVKEEEMVFGMTGTTNPGVFYLVKNKNFKHIIMPVRVQE